MKRFLALFVPAYSVTLIAVPMAAMIDHLGRGATLWGAVAVLPLWVIYTASCALPFVLPGAGLAFLFQRLNLWQSLAGKLLFVLMCAGIGGVSVLWILRSFALIAAVAGGTAGWLAVSPEWPAHRQRLLVVAAGLVAGIIVGVQVY